LEASWVEQEPLFGVAAFAGATGREMMYLSTPPDGSPGRRRIVSSMRQDPEKLVRHRFGQQMAVLLPQFEPASFGDDYPEMPCYRWRAAADLSFYATLKVNEREDRFSVLLTWMLTERPRVYATLGAPDSPLA
jgi:hypothetical protein